MKKIILLILFFYCLQITYAQPGELDPTFGNNGIVTSSLGKTGSFVIQTDGKILLAGVNGISRYNTDGSPDITFANNGTQLNDFAIASIALQSDGKFVVAGKTSQDDESSLAVARYNSDGTPDNTFSGDGKQTTGEGNYEYANLVAIQSDGKIILAGQFFNQNLFILIRYNSDGTLDNTFDGDGKLTTNLYAARFGTRSLAIQNDGKIILAGGDFGILRINSNGTPDSTFDEDGLKTIDFGQSDFPAAVAIQENGRILIVGSSTNYSTERSDICIARLNNDGSLDNTFSEDGKIITHLVETYSSIAVSIAIENDNKIIIGGIIFPFYPAENSYVIIRYSSDGNLDSSFSDDGIQSLPGGGATETYVSDFTVVNNKLYAALYSKGIARYFLFDNPYVGITNPTNNSIFNGPATIDIAALAYSPNATINKVEFYNGPTLLHTDDTSPYTYSWTNVPIGNYTLTAKAIYNAGDPTTSQEVHVTVVKTQPPTISFKSPINNASYDLLATIKLEALAEDTHVDGAISKVEFFNGRTLLATVTDSPYTFSWTNVSSGKYTLTAKATDNTGLTASAVVTVSVNNKPTFAFTIDGTKVFNTNNGLHDSSEAITVSVCGSGEYTFSVLFESTLNSLYNLYNSSVTSSGGTLRFEGFNTPGNRVIVGLEALEGIRRMYLDNPNYGGTVVQTLIPFFDVDKSYTLTPGDITGDAVVITYAGNPVFSWYLDADNDHHASRTTRACFSPGQGWTMTQLPVDDCNDNDVTPCPNIAPKVKITSPVDGASYTALATILLSANAYDTDGKIKTVDFYNGNTLIFTETWPPFYRRWYNVPAGDYIITAKATDNNGKSTTSAPVHITVLGPNFLTANITSPGNGTSFTAPATITITADVKGPNEIVKTDFYNGSTLIFSEHLFPYSNKWRNVPAGNYSVTAKATDSKGNVATSVPVAITVKSSASATLVSNKPVSLNSKTNLRDAVSVQLIPNPASNILKIRTTGLQSDKQLIVSVISASGVIMETKKFSSATQTIQLNVSSLVSGVYIIKLINGDKILYKQFVKL